MSKDKNVSLINFPDIPEQFSDAIADAFNDTTTPARQQVGTTLGDLVYLAFGGLSHYVNKKKINRSIELEYHKQKQEVSHCSDFEQYLSEISKAVKSIPNEKLCEPKLDIVGPALEASKYYISNEEIRKMFTNLIGASMNLDTSNEVHHSYVEIIKQLSPLDASNIKILSTNNVFPIAKYIVILNSSDSTPPPHMELKPHVWLFNENNDSYDDNAISLTNLERLGLVNISYSTISSIFDYESNFRGQPLFETYSSFIQNIKEGIPIEDPPKDIRLLNDASHLDIVKGLIRLTPLGMSFASICC